MRARSREINIFNLSLMDVICGAMGAFLIIMIILARYYVFDPNVTQDVDELRLRLDAAVAGLNRIRGGTEEIITELIDEADTSTKGLGASETVDQIEALTKGIRGDVDLVRGQLGAVQAEANRLEKDLQEKGAQLKRATEMISDLEKRNPFVVASKWVCTVDVDIFVESDRVSATTNKPSAPFDPRIRGEVAFRGDIASDGHTGASHEMAMISETPVDSHYKVFVRAAPEPGMTCEVLTHAMGANFFANLPNATLTESDYFDYLGVVSVDGDYKIAFLAPSEAERAAELRAVRERVQRTPPPSK